MAKQLTNKFSGFHRPTQKILTISKMVWKPTKLIKLKSLDGKSDRDDGRG